MRSVGPDSWLWIVSVLASAAAAVSLWFGAARVPVHERAGYRWLAAAALLWCTGAAGQELMSGQATGFTAPLTLADLLPLLALAPMVTGIVALAARKHADGRWPLGLARGSALATQRLVGYLLDSYVLVSALLLISWLTLFGTEYQRSGVDPQTFLLGLVRPLAGIVAVSALLPLVAAAGRRAALPYVALLAITAGNVFGAAVRLAGGHDPGGAEQIAEIVGYLVLSCAPWLVAQRMALRTARTKRQAAASGRPPAAAMISVLAATIAALLIVVSEVAGGARVHPVVVIVASSAVFALAARVFGLLRENGLALAAARVSGGLVRELADRTNDAVLICDFDGSIRYPSPSVAAYGYVADSIVGRNLAEFVHPEDRPAGMREIRRIVTGSNGGGPSDGGPSDGGTSVARFPCRVLATDGTWRPVEGTVSRYQQPGERGQLLITARDLSEQVAVEIFAAHLNPGSVRRLGLIGELHRAISEERLTLEFQPIVELSTSRITDVEALVRWPRDGVPVPQEELVRLVEESGPTVPLGDWALRESCRQLAAWRRSALDLGMSVNLSPRQISAPGFVESVIAALASNELPAGVLTIEIAEQALAASRGEIARSLSELRRHGVRVAVDDFGSGNAALGALRQLPVDIVKIDPSFISGVGEDDTLTSLTGAIVRVCNDLGMAVVAAGIERPGQLELLNRMGCAHGQGDLLAPPMTASQMQEMIAGTTNGHGPDVAESGRAVAPAS